MIRKLVYIVVLTLLGCSPTIVLYTQDDESLLIQKNSTGELWLSSLNSAQKINIISQENVGDTLFVSYKRGIFRSPVDVLRLEDKTKFVKCANQLYEISRTEEGKGFNLIERK